MADNLGGLASYPPTLGSAELRQAALQADPQHRPTHRALADLYERQGDPAEAEKHRRLAGGARP